MNPQICNDNMFFSFPPKTPKWWPLPTIDQAFSLWSLGGHWWHRWPGEDLRGLPARHLGGLPSLKLTYRP